MRARVFFPLITLGAVGRVSAIYFIGDWLEEPLTDISSFIGRYALYLTPITIALTVFQVWYSRRRGRGLPIGTLEDLEDGLRGDRGRGRGRSDGHLTARARLTAVLTRNCVTPKP